MQYTKAESAYRQLRACVIEGILEPGSALDQLELAAALGVSATPFREAIRRLEGEGLVQVTAHKQVYVAPMSSAEMHEIYETRLMLDPVAARLAAERATVAERDELTAMAEQVDSRATAPLLEHNHVLHRAIYVAAHNAVLTDTLDRLYARSLRYGYVAFKERREVGATTTHQEHEKMVAAIVAGHGYEAEHLMREHLMGALAAMTDENVRFLI